MRIGIDVTPLAKPRSGVGHYCYCLLKNLVALAPDAQFLGLATGINPIESDDLLHPIPCRRIPVPTRVMHRVWNCARMPRADVLLGGTDIFHATNYFLPPVKHAHTVLTVHDLAFLARPELCSPKIASFFARHVPRFLARADAVIACSEATKADILRYSNVDSGNVFVVHEAADEGFAPMDRDKAAEVVAHAYGVKSPFLLFVSTLEPRKNIPALLRAFARIAKDIPHTLVLAGGMGWNTEGILDTLEGLKLGNRVSRIGFVKGQADLAALYSAADAFVFPTLYEGFGLPLLEAMSCGCPVVTSNNSSVPEVTGEAALRVDAEDDEAIADSVLRILDDCELRQSLRLKGFEQARRFSWQNCARGTLEVYGKVLHEGAGTASS